VIISTGSKCQFFSSEEKKLIAYFQFQLKQNRLRAFMIKMQILENP